MDMTAEAITTIKELGTTADQARIVEHDGKLFTIDGSTVNEFIPNNLPETLHVHTLSSLVKYVQSALQANEKEQLIVHVVDPTTVEVLTPLDEYGRRKELVAAHVNRDVAKFNQMIPVEEMNIMLQSAFQDNEDRAVILKVIGNLAESEVTNASDDGVSQAVEIKSGVASLSKAKVPNPVKLIPFRTFAEVSQPTSLFIFRMASGMQALLFRVEDGNWELEAIHNVAEFIGKALEKELKSDNVQLLS